MAEYNRFVSYVYMYENNQKTLNNGFVRVETVDEKCRLYIHMKDLYGNSQTDFSVYMVRRYQGKLQGIGLGIMQREGNQGEFFHETQKDNIENSGISLNEIAGIVIIGGRGKKYGTCWDDDPFEIYRFEPYEGENKASKSEIQEREEENLAEETDLLKAVLVHEPKFISMPASEMEIVDMDKDSEVEIVDVDKDSEVEIVNVASNAELVNANTDSNTEIMDANKASEVEISENIAMAASVSLSEAALTAAPLMGNMAGKKLTLEEKLEKILRQGVKMYPFEDDQVASCIRFELQDIGMLPMKFWSYVSNSFLLNNYYSYRHLIFGRFGNGRYFLGVPGMGQQKDRFMAQLFGFKEFKAIRESDNGQSDFGYWYVVLN